MIADTAFENEKLEKKLQTRSSSFSFFFFLQLLPASFSSFSPFSHSASSPFLCPFLSQILGKSITHRSDLPSLRLLCFFFLLYPKTPQLYFFFLSVPFGHQNSSCMPCFSFTSSLIWPPKTAHSRGGKKKKHSSIRGGLQICPSSVEFTSVRNINTGVKRKCEKWVKWSELYRRKRKTPKGTSRTQARSNQTNEDTRGKTSNNTIKTHAISSKSYITHYRGWQILESQLWMPKMWLWTLRLRRTILNN